MVERLQQAIPKSHSGLEQAVIKGYDIWLITAAND